MTQPLSVLFRGVAVAALAAGSLSATAALLSYNANFNLASADITSTTSSVGGNKSDSTSGPGNVSQLLNFSQFNASLGTLQGVSISITSTYGATTTIDVVLTNDGDAGGLLMFSAAGSLAGQVSGLSGQYSAGFSANPSSLCFTAASSDGCQGGPDVVGGPVNTLDSYSNPGLAAFIGGGSFDLTASLNSALAPQAVDDNASLTAVMSGISWAGTVTVAYDYLASTANPVPETMSLYLVLAGLAAVAWRRRQG